MRPPQPVRAGEDWYTLREVAGALGLSRQAVHARVKKGQLAAEQVGGTWRVSESTLAGAVQSERKKFLGVGAVRLLPVTAVGGDEDASGQIAGRVAVIEAAIAELSEGHRRALEERDREVAVLKQRCDRLTAALHQMVDLLGAEQVRPLGVE